jgi:hypothetical protein
MREREKSKTTAILPSFCALSSSVSPLPKHDVPNPVIYVYLDLYD